MKKSNFFKWAVYALAAVILPLCFTACSDDDGDEDKSPEFITVNVAPMYEELGIDQLVKDIMAEDDDYRVKVTMLIYDKDGDLVDQYDEYADGLQPVTINTSGLLDGKYSVITYQTLANGENTEWTLADVNHISKAKVEREFATVPAEYALGLYYKEIKAKNGSIGDVITPKAAGAVIDMKMNGIDEAQKITALKIMGENRVYGMYFDPEKMKDGRWYITESGSIDVAYVDNDEDIMAGDYDKKSFTLVYGDEVPAMLVKKVKGKAGYEYICRSNLNLHLGERAVVFYDFSNSALQSQFFGTEENFRVWEFERDRNPFALNTFTEWGASQNALNKYMAKRQLYNWGNDELTNEGDFYRRLFWVEKNLKEAYFFDDEEYGRLSFAQVDYVGNSVTAQQAYQGLESKGYAYEGTVFLPDDTENADLFVSKDKKTEALLYDFKDGTWKVLFLPFNEDHLMYIVDL